MFRRTIIGISVEDVEKRRLPSKHYVYVIYVTWNDGALNVIYRRYSRFFELQSKLLDKFPDEAGSNDPSKRIIPFLPGKILFGRSHIREVALKRLESINQYCKILVKLPAQISDCDEVLAFFETAPDDLVEHSKTIERKPSKHKVKAISHPLLLDQYVAVADYTKQGRNELSLLTGSRVEVVEKTEIGWWFVSTDEGQGWVPSSHLEKEDGSQENRVVHEADPGEEERFVVVETYIPMAADEIRIDKGGFVQVSERNLDGWWLVRYQGNEGRVPATNLNKVDTLKMNRIAGHVGLPPVEVIPNLMSISNINRQKIDKLVSDSSANEKRGNNDPTNPPSPTKPLIDLNFDPESPTHKNGKRGIDENFNPLMRSSRRKAPPPRRNSVSVDKPKKKLAPPRPAPPQVEPVYVAIADLNVSVQDGVSLRQGEVVSVLEKTETGWWYVSAGQCRGWAPVSYITKRHQPKKSSSPRPPRPPVPTSKRPTPSEPVLSKDIPASASSLANILKNNQNKPKLGLTRVDSSGGKKRGDNLLTPVNKPSIQTAVHSDRERGQAQRQISNESTDDQHYQNVDDSELINDIERYVAGYPFEGTEVGEVRLGMGDLVDVMGKNVSGWWYVRVLQGVGIGEGWVPSSYLKPTDKAVQGEEIMVEGATGLTPRSNDSIYEEVKHFGYDDDDDVSTEWSDTPASSLVDVPSWSLQKTTATVEHIPKSMDSVVKLEASSIGEQDKHNETLDDNQLAKKPSESLEDVARLDEYVKTSFKGPRPVLPTKKSKDAANSQRQGTSSSQSTGQKSLESDISRKTSSNSTSPFGVALKPTGAKTNVGKEVTVTKPLLPAKKPPLSTNRPPVIHSEKPVTSNKPAVSAIKPTVGSKPMVPGNKPTPSVHKPQLPGNRPTIPATKPSSVGRPSPPMTATSKPSPPSNKPLETRAKPKVVFSKSVPLASSNNNSSSSNAFAGLKKSQTSQNGSSGSVDKHLPTKVQNLAKLFNQS